MTKAKNIGILLVINLIILIVLVYGFETYLRWTDPFLKLPFDTNYYLSNKEFYPYLEPPEGIYTWGHRVEENRFGLRDREYEVPKPPDVTRIMVLGDSFTWGVGLAVEERYVNLTEKYLNEAFPEKKFELVNLALSGGPTTLEKGVLEEALAVDQTSPDLIVVGFVLNDPQPRQKAYRIEKQRFNEKYGALVDRVLQTLIDLGLPQTAKLSKEASDNFLVEVGVIPPWEVGIDRTYDEESVEWQNFMAALQDIKSMSDRLGLPPPIFAVLNQGIFVDHVTDYRVEDDTLPIYVQWAHQAQRTADEIGFRTYNYEQEFLEQLTPEEIPVNELDPHPSAKVNKIYAAKLSRIISEHLMSDNYENSADYEPLPEGKGTSRFSGGRDTLVGRGYAEDIPLLIPQYGD